MRSFQQIIALLCALFAFALAAEIEAEITYDATVYITSTIYRVNTVTLSGTNTASLANSTSTITASIPSLTPSFSSNGTAAVAPTSAIPTSADPSGAPFTGAASHLSVNALVAAIAVGVGYLAL